MESEFAPFEAEANKREKGEIEREWKTIEIKEEKRKKKKERIKWRGRIAVNNNDTFFLQLFVASGWSSR